MMAEAGSTKYSADVRQRILDRLAAGETLLAICRDDDMPGEASVRRWAQDDPDFAEQYQRARELGYWHMADEVVEIVDDRSEDWIKTKDGWVFNKEAVARSRLRFDARRWLMSKALPKAFGDRLLDTAVGGPDIRDLFRREAESFELFTNPPHQTD